MWTINPVEGSLVLQDSPGSCRRCVEKETNSQFFLVSKLLPWKSQTILATASSPRAILGKPPLHANTFIQRRRLLFLGRSLEFEGIVVLSSGGGPESMKPGIWMARTPMPNLKGSKIGVLYHILLQS